MSNGCEQSNSDHYVIIMAGGRGERFWPVSRQATPKQLITLLGGRSFLQQAVDRVLGTIAQADHIFVITNVVQAEAVRKQLPELPTANIIAEPCGRDTCAAVTLGAALVAAQNSKGVMAVLSADHLIPTVDVFQKTLRFALDVARKTDALITLGIRPTEPATGYGYIHLGKRLSYEGDFYEVQSFVEKPSLEVAKQYLASGDYRWNAGMFIWSCKTLRNALELHQPAMAAAMTRWQAAATKSSAELDAVLSAEYPGITKISVDFALMEKAQNILVADSAFQWDDLGSWPALMRHLSHDESNNCGNGDYIGVDASGNLIYDARKKTPRTLTTLLGVRNSVIVFTDDATMIADRKETQRIKELVAKISQNSNYNTLI